ncbi:HAMP domain-containing histidine kinase [Aliifodinibius salicampi]|uniref:histidine kinase n=1 Tax=Fodinibius salicampi TaxID=1920655 RepID=A0ABT3Q193_9BACT|nr:HAMP domain-containing sensor histidine kinase [Fodinibius salicampi]MCW9713808.1 HAMP domain-containing histidine kinase [Fodinibius salicampi]
MKLITKFILIYLFVTVIVLGIGGYLSYFIIKGELNNELKWRFLDHIDRVTYLLERGKDFNSKKVNHSGDRNLEIRPLSVQREPDIIVKDTMVWHERLQQMEPNLKMTAYRTVDDTTYYISTHGALVESDDITEAVVQILLWILGMQVIGAIGVGFIVSNRLFKPFRNTLDQIKSFNLQDKEPITAQETNVTEFDDLNHFVEEMTRKAVADYKNLKEFAENASHELQTPLSIVKGKLELLTETDLSPEQYQYVEASHRSIKKLSRLSESLALLTKIENHEFTQKDEVNFTKLIQDSTQAFEEFIKLNGLEVEADLKEEVTLQIHSVLADILWTNLFQNAIKHNIEDGRIKIELTEDFLRISNTGRPLDDDPHILFERFKKADHSNESIGLGLAIIKQIAEQNDYSISYDYKDKWHTITIEF